MRMSTLRVIFVCVSLLTLSLSFSQIVGQGEVPSCPALVDQAMAAADQLCGATARNEVCYAHDQMSAQPGTLLTTPDDIVQVNLIQALDLSPLDEQASVWGVALARLQVNLPDTLPGENVTFLLYGDVEFSPVAGDSGEVVQAFRLKTGVGGVECGDTSLNGLLVQTPESGQRVSFMMNGVEVKLGSTALFTAQVDDKMIVRTLEGGALLSTEQGRSIALAGSEVGIPLDEDLQADGKPELPEAYIAGEVLEAPIEPLERDIKIAEPMDEEELEEIYVLIEEFEESDESFEEWFDTGEYETFLEVYACEHGDHTCEGDVIIEGEEVIIEESSETIIIEDGG